MKRGETIGVTRLEAIPIRSEIRRTETIVEIPFVVQLIHSEMKPGVVIKAIPFAAPQIPSVTPLTGIISGIQLAVQLTALEAQLAGNAQQVAAFDRPKRCRAPVGN